MHPSSYEQIKALVEKYQDGCTTVLDYGGRDVNGTYRPIFPEPWVYVACDIAKGPNVGIVMCSEYSVPKPDRSYDMVISGNVIEHVRNPFLAVQEMARLSRNVLIVGAPFRLGEHRYPIDCWRFLPDGMRELAGFAQLPCVESFIYGDDCYLVAKR